MIKRHLLIVTCLLLASCAGMNTATTQQVQTLNAQLKSCIQANIPAKRTAQCAIDLFNGIQAVPANDYGKPPSLNMATALYEALLKFDRGQNSSDATRAQIMYVENKFNQELEEARRRSVAENMQIARYRQQMFIQAAQMLNPPRNGISCISQNNGYLTTTNCY
jgi:hypothetical protein